MRIISGSLAGRQFASPQGHKTHPMSEKMRGAIFNALGDIEGLTVLDAFAGSGALGFEAVSRGAKSATLIDHDKHAARIIRENSKTLDVVDKVEVFEMGLHSWLHSARDGRAYDLVFADPPYDDLQQQVVIMLCSAVKCRGVLVVSWPGIEALLMLEGFELIRHKSYGDAQLAFYRKTE